MADQQIITTGDTVFHKSLGTGIVKQITVGTGGPQLFVQFESRVTIWVPAVHVKRIAVEPEVKA